MIPLFWCFAFLTSTVFCFDLKYFEELVSFLNFGPLEEVKQTEKKSEDINYVWISCICVTLFLFLNWMASLRHTHDCSGSSCSHESHSSLANFLPIAGLFQPEVNPVRSLCFVIQFDPHKTPCFASVDYNTSYLQLFKGVWQLRVSDVCVYYNNAKKGLETDPAILAIRSNLCQTLNVRNINESLCLDKIFYKSTLAEGTQFDLIKNSEATWFTVNNPNTTITVSVETFFADSKNLAMSNIAVTLLFRKIK